MATTSYGTYAVVQDGGKVKIIAGDSLDDPGEYDNSRDTPEPIAPT